MISMAGEISAMALVPCNEDRSDGSSSNSDSDSSTPPKRPRASRTVRGVRSKRPILQEKPGVYATKVQTGLANLKTGFLTTVAKTLKENTDSDDENFIMPTTKEVKQINKASLICLSSESEDEEKHNSNDVIIVDSRERGVSPSPPPSPGNFYNRRTARRTQKLKKTLKTVDTALSRISHSLPAEVIVDTSEVRGSSPIATNARDITIKVRSRSGIQRFTMKLSEAFHGVMREMANHEGVGADRIMMSVRDVTVRVTDTPLSLGLTVADIVECHIVKEGALNTSLCDDDGADVISVTVQSKKMREKVTLKMKKNDIFEKLMRQYAEKMNLEMEKLTFYFDGDKLKSLSTPEDVDMDDGDCIDVCS